MKKLLLVLPAILLTGCLTTAPVTVKFPDVPDEIKTACPDLKKVEPGTTKLSEVLGVVTDNYAQYKECKVKVDLWIDWYNSQKKIFEEIK